MNDERRSASFSVHPSAFIVHQYVVVASQSPLTTA